VVDRLARSGNDDAVPLPRPRLKDSPLDFSFSGLKSAAIRWIRAHQLAASDEENASQQVRDLLASFERAVVDQLLGPLPDLVRRCSPRLITAAGGVAANTLLRQRMVAAGAELGVEVLLPPPALTTDNAAMIAHAGQLAAAAGTVHDPRRLDAWASAKWQPPGMRRLFAERGFE
jgi:N6-L-threonylcarbamoyladenine synthase